MVDKEMNLLFLMRSACGFRVLDADDEGVISIDPVQKGTAMPREGEDVIHADDPR
jgi:hypothetical protein